MLAGSRCSALSRRRARLHVESLEDRTVPAPIGFSVRSDVDDQLYRIDLATGVATAVGEVGFPSVEALAFEPGTNRLFGLDDELDQLITIDVNTGAGTLVGSLGVNLDDVGLSFDTAGNLFISTDVGQNLFRVNPATGEATLVGAQGQPVTGLTFGQGALFGIGGDEVNTAFDNLVRIDRNTGAATAIGPLVTVSVDDGGIDFDGAGTLWGINDRAAGGSQVFTINTATGAATPQSTVTLSGTATAIGGFEGLAITPPVPPARIAAGAGEGRSPQARLFNPDGSLRFSVLAYGGRVRGGVRVATGDVNNDGFDDVIVAAGPGTGPHVKVFDGQSGVLIRSVLAYAPKFKGGVFVGAGDIDNDGFVDIITGAGAGAVPNVKVFDGETGALLRSFLAFGAASRNGVTVAGGDVNRDGFDDIITGAGPGARPNVKVFDGQSGALIRSFRAFGASFRAGVFVGAGDIDSDGFTDIITGAGPGVPPRVRVFDGETSALLRNFLAFGAGFRGGVRVSAADLDGDGDADLVTGAGPGGRPLIRGFDGSTLALLRSFLAYPRSSKGGVFVG